MYFGHRFPLTLHIRGHLLSCKLELRYLSTGTQCVGTQNDKMDRSDQNTIDGHDLWCIILLPSWPIFYKVMRVNSWLLPLQPANHLWLLTLQPMYTSLGLEFVGFHNESRVKNINILDEVWKEVLYYHYAKGNHLTYLWLFSSATHNLL